MKESLRESIMKVVGEGTEFGAGCYELGAERRKQQRGGCKDSETGGAVVSREQGRSKEPVSLPL